MQIKSVLCSRLVSRQCRPLDWSEQHEINIKERNYGFVSIKCSLSLETGWTVKCIRFSLNIQMQIKCCGSTFDRIPTILFHSKYLHGTLCIDRRVTIAYSAICPFRSAATLSISCGSSMRSPTPTRTHCALICCTLTTPNISIILSCVTNMSCLLIRSCIYRALRILFPFLWYSFSRTAYALYVRRFIFEGIAVAHFHIKSGYIIIIIIDLNDLGPAQWSLGNAAQ